WIDLGDKNNVQFANLSPGRYTFRVLGSNNDGLWSDRPAELKFSIRPPWWASWWAWLGYLLLASAIIWRLYRFQLQRRLYQQEAFRLRELDMFKNRFFTNITHEFRTPLTLIFGPAEQILSDNVPESFKAPAQIIKNNAGRLLELINQLLDVSKIESGQMEIKASTADVMAFTGKLLQGFQPLAQDKKQKLVFIPELSEWTTHFDAEKLNKIVCNLLSNAIKYTPKYGNIALSVSKKEDHTKVYIKIRVKDTGIGIAPDVLPHIFDRFYQADGSATRKEEGTGIGLALVKELVELLDGKITVESIQRKGTVFTVILPVLPAPLHPGTVLETIQPGFPAIVQEADVPAERPDDIPENDKLKLLIIEDHTEMRSYIRSCIDTRIYSITEAADGLAGIKKAKEMIPDLIISDVMMPKKDGFEVTRAVRDYTGTSHIPLILLTAKASEENRLEGISRGADVYLTKPFSPRELKLRIEKLIEIRQLMQQRYQGNALSGNNPEFKTEDRFITDLKNYITQHISDPGLGGGEIISRHFAMSRMQLYRKLKALLNSDISSYVRTVRLEIAMRLLKEKEISIAEVAYETGFSSPNHFSRTFKKAYGKSPSQVQSQ
ncbi:MAG: response regulator, partial [Sinomicrobium sp.]|nr:response regulator [Sinomicrobium sp.]